MKTPAPASASIKPLHLMAWEALTQRIEQHRLALTQNNSVFKNLTHPVMLRLSEEISSTQLTATYRFFSKLLRSTQYHEKLFRDGQRRSITFPRGTSITAQSKVFKPGKAPAGQNFIALPYQCSLIYEMQCNPDTKEVKARACLLLNVGDKNYRIDTLEHPTIKDFKNRPTKSPDSASCLQKEQQLSQNKNLFDYPKIFPFPPKPGDIAAKQQGAHTKLYPLNLLKDRWSDSRTAIVKPEEFMVLVHRIMGCVAALHNQGKWHGELNFEKFSIYSGFEVALQARNACQFTDDKQIRAKQNTWNHEYDTPERILYYWSYHSRKSFYWLLKQANRTVWELLDERFPGLEEATSFSQALEIPEFRKLWTQLSVHEEKIMSSGESDGTADDSREKKRQRRLKADDVFTTMQCVRSLWETWQSREKQAGRPIPPEITELLTTLCHKGLQVNPESRSSLIELLTLTHEYLCRHQNELSKSKVLYPPAIERLLKQTKQNSFSLMFIQLRKLNIDSQQRCWQGGTVPVGWQEMVTSMQTRSGCEQKLIAAKDYFLGHIERFRLADQLRLHNFFASLTAEIELQSAPEEKKEEEKRAKKAKLAIVLHLFHDSCWQRQAHFHSLPRHIALIQTAIANAVAIAIEEAKTNSSAQEVKSLEQNEGTAGNCREREEDKMVENAWRLWGEEAPQKIMNIIKANVPSASDNPRNPRRFFTEFFLRSDVTALAYQAVQQAKSVDDFFQRLKNGFTTELIKTETVPHPSSPYTPPLRFR